MCEATASEAAELGERTGGSFPKWFVFSAGAILAITGISKVWSGLGNSKLLAVVDPIIGIKFGHLMLAVGLAEIVIALVCFFSKRQTLALGLVAWMSTNFVVYRLGLWWMGWKKPCSCLGNLTDALHISPQTADHIMKVLLAYLLIGSYGLLFWQWKQTRLLKSISLMLVMLLSFSFSASAQSPLLSNWWQNLSPGAVLNQAESVTLNVFYLKKSKASLANDPKDGFEYFQRRTPDGEVEIKKIRKRSGRVLSTSYWLKDGKYFDSDGLIRKIEYEEGPEVEERLAGSFAHPYDDQFLEARFVGTNDCIVVRHTMGKSLFEAVANELYKDKTIQERAKISLKYLRAVKDVYVRKSDGLIIGYHKLNLSGKTLLEDMLPDTISVGVPIPAEEFAISKTDPAVKVSSIGKATEIAVERIAQRQGISAGETDQKNRKRLIAFCFLGVLGLILPIAVVARVRWQKFRRQTRS